MRMGICASLVAGLAVVACGQTSTTSSSAASQTPSQSSATVSANNVSGVGTVLVNGSGQTLYVLSSEKGGNVTCTDANGCTSVWPAVELPAGASAATVGSGITSALLGTVKDSNGNLHVTYAGYPLYTFASDSAGTAKGQGIASFGGTWSTISASGVTQFGGGPTSAAATGSSSPSTNTSGGYGY